MVHECIHPGSKIYFTCHRVKVQSRLVLLHGKLLDHGNHVDLGSDTELGRLLDLIPFEPSVMAVHASRVLDLDFSRGLALAKEVRHIFHSAAESALGFSMVVSFGRSYFI